MAKRRRPFEFHHEAILEARHAALWYKERSAEAAAKFKDELRRAELAVRDAPSTWALYLHGTRRFVFSGFPYVLVYVERDDRIVGVAVAHLKRRPGYWRHRLS